MMRAVSIRSFCFARIAERGVMLLQPLLLAAVVGSTTRPLPSPHHQLQCWSETHLNFMNPGHDLVAVKASTVQACCAACARHHNQSTRVGAGAGAGAGCRFWTFEAPCRPGDPKCFNCVLKRTDAGRRSCAGTISGGLLGPAPPPPPLPPGGSGYVPAPVIHFTPPCYDRKGGWHDTASALLHPITRSRAYGTSSSVPCGNTFRRPTWSTGKSSALRVGWEARVR
jgi:hypothetical protein